MSLKHIALAAVAAVLAFSPLAQAEEAWDRWQGHDDSAATSIDHQPWQDFLSQWLTVDPNGLNKMRYGDVDAASKAALDGYLDDLSGVKVTALARPEQMAFWINLYNALTVQVILDHYPVKSIKDIRPGFLSFHPWDKKWMSVDGEKVSLNDVEHRILRPIFKDNRVHYAINCASVGCPDLQPVAFTADNLDSLMTDAAKAYIASDRGVRFDSKGKLEISKIYSWFVEDFGKNDGEVIAHLLDYAAPERTEKIKAAGNKISDHYYDWSLNE